MAKDLLGNLAKAYNADVPGLTPNGKPNINIGSNGSPKQVLLRGGGGGTPPPGDDSGQLPRKEEGSFLHGTKPWVSTNSLLTPQQLAAQNQLLPLATDRLKKQPSFDDIRNETISHYQRNVLPKIHEGFTARTGGAPSSGVLMKQLQTGDASLQTQLAGQRAQYELGQQSHNQNLLSSLLGKSQESFYNPGDPGLLKSAASEIVPYAGKMISKKLVDLGGDALKAGVAGAAGAGGAALASKAAGSAGAGAAGQAAGGIVPGAVEAAAAGGAAQAAPGTAGAGGTAAATSATPGGVSASGKALTGTLGTVAVVGAGLLGMGALLWYAWNQINNLGTAFPKKDKNAPENAGSAPAGWMESPKSGTTDGVITWPEKTNDNGNF